MLLQREQGIVLKGQEADFLGLSGPVAPLVPSSMPIPKSLRLPQLGERKIRLRLSQSEKIPSRYAGSSSPDNNQKPSNFLRKSQRGFPLPKSFSGDFGSTFLSGGLGPARVRVRGRTRHYLREAYGRQVYRALPCSHRQ